MENENTQVQTHGVKRPWEGTTIGVLDIIGLVLMGIVLVILIFAVIGGGAMLSQMLQGSGMQNFPMASFLATMGTFLLIPVILFFILGIFITVGIFKGQKWAIIVSIIFTVLALLSSFSQGVQYLSLALNAFVLYLEIMCVKHPFYNKK
ncbi:hypothetical protein J7J83_00380 [bacterium]|nr:hypothetical protein [bacterium]